MKQPWYSLILPWVLPALLLTAWQLLSQFGAISSRVLPSPLAVIEAGIRLTRTGELPLSFGGELPAGRDWTGDRRNAGISARPVQRSIRLVEISFRFVGPNGSQRSASGDDSPGDPLVRHWGIG